MSVYEGLAGVYDRLTEDVEYHRWADYLVRQFAKSGAEIHTVLDLACGTGSLSCLLAERGFEVIGVDASPEMLSVAAEKAQKVTKIKPIFLNQSMEALDLYGTVDACVCCLDSMNYIPPQVLEQGLGRVHLFLEPGGLFVFDLRPPLALEAMDGQVFFDEREDLVCIWQAGYHKRQSLCRFDLTLFCQEGALWRRYEEEHLEYAHPMDRMVQALQEAGFSEIRQFGNLKLRAPRPNENRIFITARKGNKA